MKFYTPKQQQGSALVWLVSLTMIVGMLALVVDASLLYFEKRKLQSQANSIASVLVNDNDSCNINSTADIHPALNTELERLGIADVVTAKADWVVVDTVDGHHKVSAAEANRYQSNGASVILKKKNIGLLSFFVDEIQSSAVAKKEVYATFYTDASLLRLNTADSLLLGPVFEWVLGGNHIDLDGVSFSSIGDALFDVGDLLHYLTKELPGVNNLLNGDVPLHLVVQGLLNGVGGATTAAGQGLDQLLQGIGVETNVKLGNVLKVIGDLEVVPEGAKVPVLGLLTGLVLDLGKELDGKIELDTNKLLQLPGMDSGLLSDIFGVKLKLDIESPPSFVIAPARQDGEGQWVGVAQGADIGVELSLYLYLGDNHHFNVFRVDVPVKVKGGKSTARFIGSSCAQGSENSVDLYFEVEKQVLELDSAIEVAVAESPSSGIDEICFPSVLQQHCPVRDHSEYPTFTPKVTNQWGWCSYTLTKWWVLQQHCYGRFEPGANANVWGRCCYENTCTSLATVGVYADPQKIESISSTRVAIPSVNLEMPNGVFNKIEESVKIPSGRVLADTLVGLLESLKVTANIACIPIGEVANLLLDVLEPVLSAVLAPLVEYVIGPLLELLGVSLGEAKLIVTGVEQSKVSVIENCSIEHCEI